MEETQDIQHESKLASILSKALKLAAYPIAAATAYIAGDLHARGIIYKVFARQGFFDGRARISDADLKVMEDGKKGIQGELKAEIIDMARDNYRQKIISTTDDAGKLRRYVKNSIRFSVFDHDGVKEIARSAPKDHGDAILKLLKDEGPQFGTLNKSFHEIESDVGKLSKKHMPALNNKYRSIVREFFEDMGISGPASYFKVLNRNQKLESLVFALTAGGISLGALLTVANSKGIFDALAAQKHKEASRNPTYKPTLPEFNMPEGSSGFVDRYEQSQLQDLQSGQPSLLTR